MLIWLLTILLFAVFAALGYFKGAIRMIFPLLGLFVGIAVAIPLSPVVKPLIPKVGLENPIWGYLLPPVVVFFVVAIVFIVVGFFGHTKVGHFYKYRTDDTHRMSWERLNQRLGICMGVIAGAVYTVLIGVVVYVLGYLTVQITPDNETSAVRYLNQARAGLTSSGLDRVAAAFDPMPDDYYEASDILGLLYHNPALHTRLAAYPLFISLSEDPDFREMASDTDFLTLLAGRETFGTLINHPHIQRILGSQNVLDKLKAIDLKDLSEFLHTGVSEKYQDPPILGRWEVDPYLTFLMEKKRNLTMTAADVRLLRFEMEFIKGFRLYVMPDNRVKLKGPDVSRLIGRLEEIEKAVRGGASTRRAAQYVAPTPAPAPTTPTVNPETQRLLTERYGVTPGRGGRGGGGADRGGAPRQPAQPTQPQQQLVLVQPQNQTLAPPPTADELAAEIAQLDFTTLAEGTWSDDAGRLVITLRPSNEMPQFLVTRRLPEGIYSSVRFVELVEDDRLYLTDRKETIVMARF